jgi:hypothetical protein
VLFGLVLDYGAKPCSNLPFLHFLCGDCWSSVLQFRDVQDRSLQRECSSFLEIVESFRVTIIRHGMIVNWCSSQEISSAWSP